MAFGLRPEGFDQVGPVLGGDQVERLLVHRAVDEGVGAIEPFLAPAVGIERPVVGLGVVLQPFFEQAGDGALGRADRPVQEQNPALGSVPVRGALEDVDEVVQGPVEPEDRVLAPVRRVVEEVVMDHLLLVDENLLGSV